MFALTLLVAVQAALRLDVSTANDASNAKNRPVTKVVNLIKDMQEQLQKEAEEDQEVYEKLACWCETNDKEKTASIEEAESRITALTSSIEEGTAMSSRLNTEIKNLEKEIARNQESLDKATAMRQKELAEFNAEEKDVLQSIGALKSAIIVLSGHHEFIQVPSETLINIAAMVQWQFHKHADMLKDIVTPHQRKAVSAFIQAPGDYFDAEPTFKQSYAPQSGAIFGILKQMKETFETNLSNSQKEEMTAQAAYQDLKAAKEEEIKSGEEQRDTKTQELADTDEKLAQDKQDLDDTRNSLSADQKFLMNLKETCQNADGEFEERTKSRQEEIKACGEALAILTSDDAHDTFSKTFNFVQVGSTSEEKKTRDSAAKVLLEAAKQTHSPRLSALASRVRLDAFTKVKAAIDEMITALLQEKKDEIKHKDFCTDGMNQNERETELKQRDIEELEAKIADLTSTIDELTKAIATLQAEIAEMQTQLKRAGEDREKENADFQTTVADQRASQQILNKALDVLKAVYAKKELMQIRAKQEPAGPPPPPGFKKYEKSGGAGGVLGMIEQIIRDAKQLEAEAIQAETDSQKAYESFVKDSNKSIEEKNRDITTKTEEKASKEADKTAAEEGKETAMNEAQQLSNENADLHKSCDFVLKNFDIRQEARDQEVEALRQAKAILSGAKFFLQRRA
jgi:DNA repair exonuclease SbcCD ATPase subunit